MSALRGRECAKQYRQSQRDQGERDGDWYPNRFTDPITSIQDPSMIRAIHLSFVELWTRVLEFKQATVSSCASREKWEISRAMLASSIVAEYCMLTEMLKHV